jgi:polar amino acid transport system substrate-binding protein
MKKLFYLLAFVTIFALLTACAGQTTPQPTPAPGAAATPEPAAGEPDDLMAEVQRRGVIRISTDPNYEPQSFLTAQGEFVGFDVDVAREIAQRLGVTVEFVTPDWDLITAGNWGGRWDMSVGSMTITTAREQVLLFARPAYYYTPAQFAAATNSGINTLEDIAGQNVCVGSATTYETWLSGNVAELGLPATSLYAEPPANVTVVPLTTDQECAQTIQVGRREFQVFLSSNTVVEAAIAAGVPVQRVGRPVFSEELAVAFDRNANRDPARLAQRVGEIISEMHADGTLSRLSEQWFGDDLTESPTGQ